MVRVGDFYNGKSVFMTGASGYLGVILLETLLRCFPGIRSIYILLRGKKGISPDNRRDAIFKREIFNKLRETQPDVFKKVHVVAGDVSRPNLGMGVEDIRKITEEVTVIFHVAASISFMKPLKFMLKQNSKSLDYVIELCRNLKHLDALVYTSTAYSNCNQPEIEERIYQLPFPAQRLLDKLENDSEEDLNSLMSQCHPSFPNYYTFSKCVAENILLEKAASMPVAVVRPSIIICTWKGPQPGYIEEGSGMVDLALAIGKGFVRVVHADPDIRFDVIPVDVVANTHITAAWSVGTGRSSSPFVVNCTSGDMCDTTVSSYTHTLFEMTLRNPLPKAFQTPALTIQKNTYKYLLMSLIEHYTPAFVIDGLLSLSGRKPRLMSLYRFYDKVMMAMDHFLTHQWTWHTRNFKLLDRQMDPDDRKLFPIGLEGMTVATIAQALPTGAPFYKWEIDSKKSEERQRVTNLRYILTTSIKITILTFLLTALYIVTTHIIYRKIFTTTP